MFLHLASGLVSEGEGEDVEGVYAFLNEVGDAVCEGASFATASTSDDHHRAFCAGSSFALGFIEL